jgi:hypothetical protein
MCWTLLVSIKCIGCFASAIALQSDHSELREKKAVKHFSVFSVMLERYGLIVIDGLQDY